MDKVTAYFQGEMLRIKKEDPARFQDIYDHECPHHYCLPSFHHNHTCDLCWKNALGISCRNQKCKYYIRMMIQKAWKWARRLKGGAWKKC